MTELYSRSLSPEARSGLIDFVEAYIETVTVSEVDEKAETAKIKAIEVLNTDIDILVFITTIASFYGEIDLVEKSILKKISPRKAAELIVEITERAHQIDKSSRPGGS